jgi:hypothetical protein
VFFPFGRSTFELMGSHDYGVMIMESRLCVSDEKSPRGGE